MDDLLGIGKGADKLLDVISKAVGTLYKPVAIRKQGEAEAYAYKLMQEEKINAKTKEITSIAAAKAQSNELTAVAAQSLDERIKNKECVNKRRRQINLESVIEKAINNQIDPETNSDIDPDWLTKFVEHAEEANSDRMRDLWGKILAGEISKPGKFSVKCLETIQKMTQKEACIFQCACSLASFTENIEEDSKSIFVGIEIRTLLSLFFEIKRKIKLHNYGLSYPEILVLGDLGLIHGEELIWTPFEKKKETLLLNCNGIRWAVSATKRLQFTTYRFTPLGEELSQLIEESPNQKYIQDFEKLIKPWIQKDNGAGS